MTLFMEVNNFDRVFEQLQRAPRRKAVLLSLLKSESDEQIATALSIHPGTVRKQIADICSLFGLNESPGSSKRADLVALFAKNKPELLGGSPASVESPKPLPQAMAQNSKIAKIDWGSVPNTGIFHGRTEELKALETALLVDRCQVLVILGLGGLGKTALAIRLAEQMQPHFDYIIWRSLREKPTLSTLLDDLMRFLSDGKAPDFNGSEAAKTSHLIEKYLQKSRCLVVLDNAESILLENAELQDSAGFAYRQGCEGYGTFFDLIGKLPHQSCVVLTSRTEPGKIAIEESSQSPIQSFLLEPMKPEEALDILRHKDLSGSDEELLQVVAKYSGNPLALKIVSTFIQGLFNGNVSAFLEQLEDVAPFIRIEDLLQEQFQALPELEKQIMYWLAINREPVTVQNLSEDMVEKPMFSKLLSSLENLKRRSLIEPTDGRFTLQNVVMEYVIGQLIKAVSQEIDTERFDLFNTYALIKATAKDYIRNTQIQLILEPITKNITDVETKLVAVLKRRDPNIQQKGYAIGNILNLLLHCCEYSLNNLDLSGLTIWQAYLRGVNLQGVDFRGADLHRSRFTEAFGTVLCVASNREGTMLAMGDTKSKIRLRDPEGRQLLTLEGHENWVRSIAFSPDGKILVSGSDDWKVMLWNTSTGQLLNQLEGHRARVWSVAFSPDGQIVASSGEDQTLRLWHVDSGKPYCEPIKHVNWVRAIAFSPKKSDWVATGSSDRIVRLWDIKTAQCIREFQGHQGRVRSLAFSPDGTRLISAGDDRVICLWDVATGKRLRAFEEPEHGHQGWVRSLAFSPDGRSLASSSEDSRILIWDVETGECRKRLEGSQGHTERVWSIAFVGSQADSDQTLLSCSDDKTVKFWDARTGECLKTLEGHTDWAWSIAFSPDQQTLVSGSEDRTVKIWDLATQSLQKSLDGHTGRIRAIAVNPKGTMIASGSDDRRIILWNRQTDNFQILEDHTDRVLTLSFSPDGSQLVSGGDDQCLRIWDVRTGQCFKLKQKHGSWIWSTKFSLDGKRIASGSEDRTIQIWDAETKEPLNTLRGHTGWVRSVAFSPDGKLLASGSEDQTIKLWHLETGACLQTLQGDVSWIRSIAFSPDGKILASVGEKPTVEIWDLHNLDLPSVTRLKGHQERLWSVAFSPDGTLIATSSEDGEIRLWDVATKTWIKSIRSPRLYENMKIAGVTHLTKAQINTLKTLGATEANA